MRYRQIPAHRTVGRTLALCAMAACAGEPSPTGAPAPGAPAQVVLTSISWAGGRAYHDETRIDSASGRYSVRSCIQSPGEPTCVPSGTVREGSVLPSMLRDLFARTLRADFRALKPRYVRPPGATPPDPATATLELTVHERRRTISWDQEAMIPLALTDFLCLLRAARGDLLLCD